jgi:hypothetical protein
VSIFDEVDDEFRLTIFNIRNRSGKSPSPRRFYSGQISLSNFRQEGIIAHSTTATKVGKNKADRLIEEAMML